MMPLPVASDPPALLTRRQIRERTIRALATRAEAGSERRRQELLEYVVEINMGIATAVVSWYAGSALEPDDLRKVAHAALTRAAREFEPGGRHEFISHAVPLIRRELGRHLQHRGRTVRTPLRLPPRP